jgi:hypothetical protein
MRDSLLTVEQPFHHAENAFLLQKNYGPLPYLSIRGQARKGRSAALNRATVRSACALQTLILRKVPILISKTGFFLKINFEGPRFPHRPSGADA